jgi:hypothetical protein
MRFGQFALKSTNIMKPSLTSKGHCDKHPKRAASVHDGFISLIINDFPILRSAKSVLI